MTIYDFSRSCGGLDPTLRIRSICCCRLCTVADFRDLVDLSCLTRFCAFHAFPCRIDARAMAEIKKDDAKTDGKDAKDEGQAENEDDENGEGDDDDDEEEVIGLCCAFDFCVICVV